MPNPDKRHLSALYHVEQAVFDIRYILDAKCDPANDAGEELVYHDRLRAALNQVVGARTILRPGDGS